MGYKNILVTLDGSLLAEQSLRHVVRLAEPRAVIHVLSIVNEPVRVAAAVARSGAYLGPLDSGLLASLQDRDAEEDAHLMRNRHGYLEQVTAELAEAGYTFTRDVRAGDVARTIIDTARDGCDVIIMATHGRTGLSRAFMGSVAETVLHQAPCPVLLIPVLALELII